MPTGFHIPEPFLFNPVKHHLDYIRNFIYNYLEAGIYNNNILLRELKHIGNSVTDVYTGFLQPEDICAELNDFLCKNDILQIEKYILWTGKEANKYRIKDLSDGSRWTMKYHNNDLRYVHFFPARFSKNTLRIKSNSLKSALLYNALVGKDKITVADLNKVRTYLNLPPVKDVENTEAITEMIEILSGHRE